MSETQPTPSQPRVIVVGAGIGGLTAGALLAQQGYSVLVVEQAYVPGGCASTFKRRGFTFDVGATQVAGLEPGGIHQRIFQQLGIEPPEATPCDPACAVILPDESEPINVWRDPEQWREERHRQFPGSERFWGLMEQLFQISWRFQSRDPVLPPRNLWDIGQLLQAVRPDTLLTLPLALLTVGDALRFLGLADNQRLRTFLDMQLKLYSQVRGEETALLYAATALGVSQAPQGIYHLAGSMQVLSHCLVKALRKYNGKLLLRHTVEKVHREGERVTGVTIREQKTRNVWTEAADQVVANVTVQNLRKLVNFPATPTPLPSRFFPPTSLLGSGGYQYRIDKLPAPQGAFVLYLGVTREAIPENCPPHLQFLYDYEGEIGEQNSLFVSVSQPGDGRAPEGKATITASAFVDPRPWWQGTKAEYDQRKREYEENAVAHLQSYFHLTPDTIIHQEAATPRTFARFTAREMGYVGGVGQRVFTFGPFGFGTRTPLENLWLVGDSTHPGEGTAGVSYSALTAVRQLNQETGFLPPSD
ncbi:MAG: C-3',4' desaturase CrtD [Kamptonema sp. SIO4C4]|nr:C-3',4' desaturase CrtD [Kamptonema sp. SIO4C4]